MHLIKGVNNEEKYILRPSIFMGILADVNADRGIIIPFSNPECNNRFKLWAEFCTIDSIDCKQMSFESSREAAFHKNPNTANDIATIELVYGF